MPIKQKETNGQRLARIRKEKGYTQDQLAKKIGTIQAIISDYERDRTRLQADMALRLALVLNVSTDELLGRKTVEKEKVNLPRARLWNKFQKILTLPEKDQRAIMRMVNSLTKN